MDYDQEKVDEVTFALMYLVIHDENEYGARIWKGFDWDTMDRLYMKGLISNPVGKAKSVTISKDAINRSKELFEKHFALPGK